MRSLLFLLATGVAGLAQTDVRYDRFLREVSALAETTGVVELNGEPSTFVQPNPQDVLSLNGAEWRALKTIADEFRSQSEALDDAARETTFEIRLGLVAEQNVTPLRQRQAALERRRAEALGRQVERMKRELAGRYEELRSFVESKESGTSYFPRQSATGRPTAKGKAKAR